jgi:hypothetical protein
MYDAGNIIYEKHDLLFQYFGHIREISDIAKAEDCHNFLPRNERIRRMA